MTVAGNTASLDMIHSSEIWGCRAREIRCTAESLKKCRDTTSTIYRLSSQSNFLYRPSRNFSTLSIDMPYIVPVTPPLTEMNCAVIQRLFSETNSSVASARSSGAPKRSAARVCANMALLRSVGVPSGFRRYSFDMSVGTAPGARVLTVMPRVLPSWVVRTR